MRFTTLFIAFIFSLPLLTGCQQDNPFGTVYVEGTVTLDGAAIDGVSVTFIPRDSGEQLSAGGVTSANGKFTLTAGGSPAGSGARPGTYDVIFSKEEIPQTESPEEAVRLYGGGQPPVTYVIPRKYGSPVTSGIEPITVDTDRKKNSFTFVLTSE